MSDPNSTSTEKYGKIPCSFQALIYQAMSGISKYELEQMEAYSKYMVAAAMTYGGLTEDADGNLIINRNSDGTIQGGLIGEQINLGIQSADKACEAGHSEAVGQLISASISGAVFVGGLASAHSLSNKTNELNSKKEIHSRFDEKLNQRAEGDVVAREPLEDRKARLTQQETRLSRGGNLYTKEGKAVPEGLQRKIDSNREELAQVDREIAERKAIETKVREITTSRSSAKEFIEQSDTQTADITSDSYQFNQKVIEHMKASGNDDDLKALRKHNQALDDNYSSQIDSLNSKHMNFMRQAEIFNNMGTSAAMGGAKWQSATQQSYATKADTYRKAVEQCNGQFASTISDAQQKANSFQSDADQTAASYGPIKI